MEKNGVAFGGGGPSESYIARNCIENTAPHLSKGFAVIDSFSSDKVLVVKSHLIGTLRFLSLQSAFGGRPLPKPGPARPAKKSEPLPHAAETLLLAHYP